ncbi:SLAP domain-containing protein [Bacillus sp. mrc49]|uniref:SLAP domain-containing protein n=1 Tax=Bacillus sp. mrc49 TaxID=2054913 RepID=UPI000C271679|nr:SLAP domain-containing protein [Bacillus sp. mrc49]PJN89163.1 hypothetical protein CVN76_16800 [Bacillus sp. mrc49]
MSLFNKGINERKVWLASNEHDVLKEADAVQTALLFHEDWHISKQEEYVYRFHHQQLPLLKPNQISISGVKLVREEEDVIAIAFLRNSLEKPIRFEVVNILLVDGSGRALAKKAFDLSVLGEVPARSSIAWQFLFEEHDRLTELIPEDWQIVFEWT